MGILGEWGAAIAKLLDLEGKAEEKEQKEEDAMSREADKLRAPLPDPKPPIKRKE